MNHLLMLGVVIAGMALLNGGAYSAQQVQADPQGHTICISTGDAQVIIGWPFDSELSVRTGFETLARDMRINRVWWRGSQVELYDQYKRMRRENFSYDAIMQWWLHCNDVNKTNKTAIETAHRLGMTIYAISDAFDFWCDPTAGGSGTPFEGEDVLRIEHPEWIPVNKYGTRRQQGPLEFGYPEVRKIFSRRLSDYVITNKYDGLVLYTYSENFASRYPEEFGYNDVVVEDFKKLYGVDIRTQPFDRQAWARLRGSYFTEFLRELHEQLAAHGKKLAIYLDKDDPDWPQLWHGMRNVGHIQMDWRTWAKEGIVDELSIFWPGDAKTAQTVIQACKGTGVTVSMFQTSGPLPAGIERISSGGDLESGYKYEARAIYSDAKTPPPSAEALKSEDPHGRRQWLFLVSKGKLQATASQVIPMLEDPDLYVRRGAVRVLEKMKEPLAVQGLERALKDPENSVRCLAAVALGNVGTARSMDTIFDAVADGGMFQFNQMAAVPALIKLSSKDTEKIVKRISDSRPTVQRAAILTIMQQSHGDFPEAKRALLEVVRNGTDQWNRVLAVGALVRYRHDRLMAQVIEETARDADQIVQTWATTYMVWLVSTSSSQPYNPASGASVARLSEPVPFELAPADSSQGGEQRRVLKLLVDRFMEYGDGSKRVDAQWGWRLIGNAILCFGSEGRAALEQIMYGQDKVLRDRVWRVIYIPQKFSGYVPATVQQDEAAHLQRVVNPQ